LIHDSVCLEFNKRNAFDMQKAANQMYDRTVDGWKVQSIPVIELSHMSIFMKKALGITARRFLEQEPKTYRQIMKILSGIEYRLLLGITDRKTSRDDNLFANPDFHDGQVLVDATNKTITILDFGQAVPLTDSERQLGLMFLRAASKLDSPIVVRDWIQLALGTSLNVEELKGILSSPDRMGRFVKLVAKIRARGGRVPIGSVHWVMAVNRQLALSKKIGTHLNLKVGALLLASKLHVPMSTYNEGLQFLNRYVRFKR